MKAKPILFVLNREKKNVEKERKASIIIAMLVDEKRGELTPFLRRGREQEEQQGPPHPARPASLPLQLVSARRGREQEEQPGPPHPARLPAYLCSK